jgi:hypothetical protein
VLVAQGNVAGALRIRRDSLGIAARIAAADRSDSGQQGRSDRLAPYRKVVDVLMAEANQTRAFSLPD